MIKKMAKPDKPNKLNSGMASLSFSKLVLL
jgi:hypothetical protein